MSIPSLPSGPTSDNPIPELKRALSVSDVILDAIFGFSFQPPVRAPFDAALPLIARAGRPIVSVDVPSGWNVDEGKADVIFVGRAFQKNPGMVWQFAEDLGVQIKVANQIEWAFLGRGSVERPVKPN